MRYKRNLIGGYGERFLCEFFGMTKIKRRAWDLMFKDLRMEVKTSLINSTDGWFFNLRQGHQLRWANYFIFIALVPVFWLPARIYFIPKEKLIGRKAVYIGIEQKDEFNKFRIK